MTRDVQVGIRRAGSDCRDEVPVCRGGGRLRVRHATGGRPASTSSVQCYPGSLLCLYDGFLSCEPAGRNVAHAIFLWQSPVAKPYGTSNMPRDRRFSKCFRCWQVYAPEHALKGGYLYDEWDADLVRDLVDGMTPRSARLDVQTRAYDALTERIKQVKGQRGLSKVLHPPHPQLP